MSFAAVILVATLGAVRFAPAANPPDLRVSVAERVVESGPDSASADTLAWLVGQWTATEPGARGDSVYVTMNCRWLTTHQGIAFDVSFTHGRTGKPTPHYDGVYYWDPAQHSFASWQVDENGQVGTATMTLIPKGLEQTTHIVHRDGKAHFTKTRLERIDANSFRLVGMFRPANSETWMSAIDQIYRRVR